MKGVLRLVIVLTVSLVAAVPLVAAGAGGGLNFPTLEDAATIKSKKKNKTKKNLSSSEILAKNDHIKRQQKSRPSERGVKWISIAVLLKFLLAFKSFAAPFLDPLGEPRQATASSIYFSFIAVLYVWLASVTMLTIIPHVSTHYNVITATALFFYMGFISVSALLAGRFIIRCCYYAFLLWKRGMITRAAITSNSTKGLPTLVRWHRPFRRICKSSLMLSAILCSFYAHCWSRSLSGFKVSRTDGASFVCQGIFLPLIWLGFSSQQQEQHTCAEEFSIWILWAAGILGHLFYYLIHEFSGLHHKGYTPSRKKLRSPVEHILGLDLMKSSSSFDSNTIQQTNSDDGEEDDVHHDERDSWPSLSATLQNFKRIERPQGTLPMVSWYSNIVFSTGFDILLSAHVFLGRFDARKMQVALLGKQSKRNGNGDSISNHPEGLFDFSDCDTANGFWFDFMSDCGDGFNSSYQVARMLAQPKLHVYSSSTSNKRRIVNVLPRGKVLVIGGDLAYPDPTPENYERRFFRTFEDAMQPPPTFQRSHISIDKPAFPIKGWTSCEKLDPSSRLSSYDGPCTFLIPGNHDWFDGLATYTRYILSRDWLGGWLMPQRTSYFCLRLPHNWWVLGFDLALDDDIDIEQFTFFAHCAKQMEPHHNAIIVTHVPHWVLDEYENHENAGSKENNLKELIRTHFRSKVRLRVAGDLHHYTRHMPLNDRDSSDKEDKNSAKNKPVLIVAGGGGAFAHPTHCFEDQIRVGEDQHVRACAYPIPKVSKHLSWLNLWQFRWRNWRFDILWAVTYFGMASSFFPLCGVYEDYLNSNPSQNLGNLLLWTCRRVLLLMGKIFVSGRVSLIFTIFIIGLTFGFTDKSHLKWRTHLGWSVLHALAHISSALLVLLFVETMAEFVMKEGMVASQNVGRSQSLSTGLASSIFDEYNAHFSHVLEDFHIVGNNSTLFHHSQEELRSCRADEELYEKVSSTFSWIYREAPLLKTVLAVFDLPGTIGSTHMKMCKVLCSGNSPCTYSNEFLLYQQLDRATILKYLSAISLYFVIFAVPIAGNVFGTWLALSLNVFNCQYDEGFSSLRMEHWKNFLKFNVGSNGDLEIFTIGLQRVPKSWKKDPHWGGNCNNLNGKEATSTAPSWSLSTPSKWIPRRNTKKFLPEVIDHVKIKA